MAKQAITLKIAGKSYPFNIESGKEEIYRLAEREVNSYLALKLAPGHRTAGAAVMIYHR